VIPEFLGVAEVEALHQQGVATFGGLSGVLNRSLLESAVGQPYAWFNGGWLHPDLFLMAAAYMFHLIRDHPFWDGNKRVGTICALVFLERNGVPMRRPHPELYDLAMEVQAGTVDKPGIAARLRAMAAEPDLTS